MDVYDYYLVTYWKLRYASSVMRQCAVLDKQQHNKKDTPRIYATVRRVKECSSISLAKDM